MAIPVGDDYQTIVIAEIPVGFLSGFPITALDELGS
jgi:hypothetical protein